MAASEPVKPTPYQRRKALAIARGFSSPYAERKAKLQAQGYRSPREYTRARKAAQEDFRRGGGSVGSPDRLSGLMAFGLTPAEFERIREANRAHAPEVREDARVRFQQKAWRLQDYNTAIDADEGNYSAERIGYIKAFYDAVTNPDTNFYSIRPSDRWTMESSGSAEFQKWLNIQAKYLIGYMEYDADSFDERYGGNSPVAAALAMMG